VREIESTTIENYAPFCKAIQVDPVTQLASGKVQALDGPHPVNVDADGISPGRAAWHRQRHPPAKLVWLQIPGLPLVKLPPTQVEQQPFEPAQPMSDASEYEKFCKCVVLSACRPVDRMILQKLGWTSKSGPRAYVQDLPIDAVNLWQRSKSSSIGDLAGIEESNRGMGLAQITSFTCHPDMQFHPKAPFYPISSFSSPQFNTGLMQYRMFAHCNRYRAGLAKRLSTLQTAE
jgi:hypothetical protein